MAAGKEQIQSELLVIRYMKGNDQAFDELVHIWERPLFYYIRRLVDTEEDAWDTLQEVWLKVSRKLRRLRDPAAFPAWLYKLARNSVMDHLRNNHSFKFVPEALTAYDNPRDEGTTLSLDLDAEELHWGLAQLSNLHREVLILHFLEGFSLAEISDITNVPVGTVKSRIYFAKQSLREMLERERRKS
jgi:RNA polymerase sigma-70 factor (ECF subfamily)